MNKTPKYILFTRTTIILHATATLACYRAQTVQRTCATRASIQRTCRWLATSVWRHRVTTLWVHQQVSARHRATHCVRFHSVSPIILHYRGQHGNRLPEKNIICVTPSC